MNKWDSDLNVRLQSSFLALLLWGIACGGCVWLPNTETPTSAWPNEIVPKVVLKLHLYLYLNKFWCVSKVMQVSESNLQCYSLKKTVTHLLRITKLTIKKSKDFWLSAFVDAILLVFEHFPLHFVSEFIPVCQAVDFTWIILPLAIPVLCLPSVISLLFVIAVASSVLCCKFFSRLLFGLWKPQGEGLPFISALRWSTNFCIQ